MDSVRKETHVVSAMIPHLETDAKLGGRKRQSSSLAPKAKAQTDGKILPKSSGRRGEKRQKNVQRFLQRKMYVSVM